MSKQEEIAALKEEIEKKEKQIYRVNKEMNAWSKGMAKSHANAKMARLFVESERREIAELQAQLLQLKQEK